jgi:hypothetical protein
MPDRHISVFGNVVVGDVHSPDSSKPNARVAFCEVALVDGQAPAIIETRKQAYYLIS